MDQPVAGVPPQDAPLRGLSASGASRTLVLNDGVPLNDPFGGWVSWSKVPRLPGTVVEGLVDHFGTLQKLLSAGVEDLQVVEGVGELRARSVREGLSRLAESSITERYI